MRRTITGRWSLVMVGAVIAGCGALPATAEAASRIAWSRDGDIFTMRPDGSHKRQITNNARTETAVWSPSGAELAVIKYPGSAEQRTAIFVVGRDGSGAYRVGRARYSVQNLAWSSDGTKLVFCDLDLSQPDLPSPQYPAAIKLIDLSAHTETRLTDFDELTQAPTWSPDGSEIAFTMTDQTDVDIWKMNAGGTERLALTTDNDTDQLAPVWSPAGDVIAYQRVVPKPGGQGGDSAVVIESMTSTGSSVAQLTHPVHAFDEAPQWAPDGSELLFFRLDTNDYTTALKVISDNGNDEHLVTMVEQPETVPIWSPNSSAITFSKAGNVFVVGADGTGKTRVVGNPNTSDFGATWGP